MLIGEYRSKVGAKNRIALPKKLREYLGESVVVMRGYEGALLVVSQNDQLDFISIFSFFHNTGKCFQV